MGDWRRLTSYREDGHEIQSSKKRVESLVANTTERQSQTPAIILDNFPATGLRLFNCYEAFVTHSRFSFYFFLARKHFESSSWTSCNNLAADVRATKLVKAKLHILSS